MNHALLPSEGFLRLDSLLIMAAGVAAVEHGNSTGTVRDQTAAVIPTPR